MMTNMDLYKLCSGMCEFLDMQLNEVIFIADIDGDGYLISKHWLSETIEKPIKTGNGNSVFFLVSDFLAN